MNTSSWYFAYGSNMSADRMRRRGVQFVERVPAVLEGWELTFDKRSKSDSTVTFANVVPADGGVVEGVLYQVPEEALERLDRAEGAPDHYERLLLEVRTADGALAAWVYVATPAWRSTSGCPTGDYLQLLLDGSDMLSPGYRAALERRWRDALAS